jgi:FdhD protein
MAGQRGVERVTSERDGTLQDDELIVEEPLDIRISNETLAVTMRTPGHDVELVLGFLHSEGVISFARDVSSITHCAKNEESKKNTIEVVLAPGVKPPVDPESGMLAKRGTLVSSACGVCGRASIDDLLARAHPLPEEGARVHREIITDAARALRDRQPLFHATGACHAASLVTFDGHHVATFEDVGRHNAVDKVIGHCVRAGALPLANHVLVVSGRSSFEIVQKAVVARIPVVASVSAATSLAVSLAKSANVTLCGFVRDDRITVYAGSV